MRKQTVRDIDVKGKRVLVRVDFNVSLHARGSRASYRVRRTMPTVKWLSEHGCRVVLMSHFGRPAGRRVKDLSLRPFTPQLEQELGDKELGRVGVQQDLGDGSLAVE